MAGRRAAVVRGADCGKGNRMDLGESNEEVSELAARIARNFEELGV